MGQEVDMIMLNTRVTEIKTKKRKRQTWKKKMIQNKEAGIF